MNIALIAFIFILTASLIFGASVSLFSAKAYALQTLKDNANAINNYPYTPPPVSVDKINFQHKWFQSFYDWAYREQVSTDFNGSPTSDHVVLSKERITFYGYFQNPYFDAIFTQDNILDNLEFDFIPVQLNFHCLGRTGFFINSHVSNNKISGYMFAIEVDGTKTHGLYYKNLRPGYALYKVEDLDLNLYNQNFSYDSTYYLPKAAASVERIGFVEDLEFTETSPKMHFRIESTDNSFKIYLTFGNNPEVELFNQVTPSSSDRGFGVFMQNVPHACNALTITAFEKFYISALQKDDEVQVQVNFVLNGITKKIAETQTATGYVGGSYKITPPVIEGYKYVGASKNNLDLIAYDANSENNVINLYYEPEAESEAESGAELETESGAELETESEAVQPKVPASGK